MPLHADPELLKCTIINVCYSVNNYLSPLQCLTLWIYSHASHWWICKWNASIAKTALIHRHRIRNNQISIVALALFSPDLFGPKSPTISWHFALVLHSLYNNRQSIRLRRTLNNVYAFDYLCQFDWHYLFIAFLSFTSSIRLIRSSLSMYIVSQHTVLLKKKFVFTQSRRIQLDIHLTQKRLAIDWVAVFHALTRRHAR